MAMWSATPDIDAFPGLAANNRDPSVVAPRSKSTPCWNRYSVHLPLHVPRGTVRSRAHVVDVARSFSLSGDGVDEIGAFVARPRPARLCRRAVSCSTWNITSRSVSLGR